MGRELLIVWAGRHQRQAWEDLCADYRQRIAREVPLRDQWVKARLHGDSSARQRAEGQALLAVLPDPCWTIALDPQGIAHNSVEFADLLARLHTEWPHPVAFLIGSDLGLSPAVLQQARQRLSLSPLIFGHELARLVLYEQLYRAVSLRRGINYHRQPL